MPLLLKSNQTLWTPERIDTALWLDAADGSTITTIDGGVSEWRDKSGNLYHATQSNSINRPTVNPTGLNGMPVIALDGSDDYFVLPLGVALPNTYSMYFVLKTDSRNGYDGKENSFYYCEQDSGNGSKNSIVYRKDDFGLAYDQFPSSGGYASTGAETFVDSVVLIRASQSSSNSRSLFVNGGLIGSATEVYSGGAITGVLLGYKLGINRYSLGFYSEIVFTHSLDNPQKIEGYLAHKWGLTANLPVDHPYKNYPPRGL